MKGYENLKPGIHKLTREERSAGGKKSAEVQKKKRLIKEQMNMLMGLPIKSDKTKKMLEGLGIKPSEMNNQMAMIIAVYQKALKGDVNAFNTIRDTLGETITNKLEIQETPKIIDDISE